MKYPSLILCRRERLPRTFLLSRSVAGSHQHEPFRLHWGHDLLRVICKAVTNDTGPHLHSPIPLPTFTLLDFQVLLFSIKWLASSNGGQEKMGLNSLSRTLVCTGLFIKIAVVPRGCGRSCRWLTEAGRVTVPSRPLPRAIP